MSSAGNIGVVTSNSDETTDAIAIHASDVARAGVFDSDQLEDLHEMFGAEGFASLLAKFGGDLRRRMEIVRGEASRADVASNAHALISSGGALGFTAFSDLFRSIERIAQGESDMGPSRVAFATGAEHVLRTIATINGSTTA